MKFWVSILLICSATGLVAQSGNYFLTHHAPTEEHSDNVCFDMVQDNRGVMYFATKGGVLEFDGRSWDMLQGTSAVYSLIVNAEGVIYWSGAKGFGLIGTDEQGFQKMMVLSDSSARNIFQSIANHEYIYFLSNEAIHIFHPADRTTQVIRATNVTGSFTGLFELFGKLYVNTEQEGLFQIESNTLVRASLQLGADVVFFSRIENIYVLGTADNKLYSYSENHKLTPITIQDQAYADASVLIAGSWINRQLLALGTLRGGVMFVNPITGKTQEIINYSTGLPDNEVFALMPDVQQNIWIAHDYGFTKVSPSMPVRSFSHYPGLQGNLLCAYSLQNSVYVGTSLGLFKLQKEDMYDELVYFVDVEVPGKKTTSKKEQQQQAEPQQEPKLENESKKGGFFSFLRRNRDKNKKAVPETNTTPTTTTEKSKEPEEKESKKTYRKEKRVEKVLRSSQFVFKKVAGIDAKVTHLVEVNNKLLASGLGGIYEVNDIQSRVILPAPVRHVYFSADNNTVLASTYSDDVHALVPQGNNWKSINLIARLDDQINYMFDGANKELWLCGLDKVYCIAIEGDQINLVQTLSLNNPNFETTMGVALNNDIVLANGNGFYRIDRQANNIASIDSLPKPSHFFAHNGTILYRDQHGWNVLGGQQEERNLRLLNLFQDLRFIATNPRSKDLWMISGSNELFKFYTDQPALQESAFPLFLKSIINRETKIGIRNVKIEEEQSAVRFAVTQPDYLGPQAIEFRYMLKGMNETWSDWSTGNNIIDFPYLPPGDYALEVQAKNIFGKVTALESMPFEVLPPYWKRSWFYALEFAIFASLVMLSFRLSTRYRIISRLLSLLTIILLIQFIQTVIEATIITKSPVIDFVIQVFVALLILPVEGYLRNVMLRSLDTSSKFYRFVVPKGAPTVIEKENTDD